MKDELQAKGFQTLTEEEAIHINGGGIASFWVNFARNITNAAMIFAPVRARTLTNGVLGAVFSGLSRIGL